MQEPTYKTLYSDVGHEDLETWLRLGLVRFLPNVHQTSTPGVGFWLAVLRACDGIAYIYKVCGTRDRAELFAYIVTPGVIWHGPEVWHVVAGTGVVEHMRRESDGKLCSIRWACRVV